MIILSFEKRTVLKGHLEARLAVAKSSGNSEKIRLYTQWLQDVLYAEPLFYVNRMEVPLEYRTALLPTEKADKFVCTQKILDEIKEGKEYKKDWAIAKRILEIKQQAHDTDNKIRRKSAHLDPQTGQHLQTKYSYHYIQDSSGKMRLIRAAGHMDYLGKGAFGKVKKATDEFGNMYALKIEDPANSDGREEKVILENLKQLEGQYTRQRPAPTFDKYRGVPMKDKRYSLLELHAGVSLESFIKTAATGGKTSVWIIQQLALQAAMEIEYAHSNNVFHLDIKPGNMMVAVANDFAMLRAIDWGISMLVAAGIDKYYTDTLRGTPSYLAPEISKLIVFDKRTHQASLVTSHEYRLNKIHYILAGFELSDAKQLLLQSKYNPHDVIAVTTEDYQLDFLLQVNYKIINTVPVKKPLYSRHADVYSLGIMFYYDLGLRTPIVLQMLNEDPEKRPEIKEVIEQLQQGMLLDPRNIDPNRQSFINDMALARNTDGFHDVLKRMHGFASRKINSDEALELVVATQKILASSSEISLADNLFLSFMRQQEKLLQEKVKHHDAMAKELFAKYVAIAEARCCTDEKISYYNGVLQLMSTGGIKFEQQEVATRMHNLIKAEKLRLEQVVAEAKVPHAAAVAKELVVPEANFGKLPANEEAAEAYMVPKPEAKVKKIDTRRITMQADPRIMQFVGADKLASLDKYHCILMALEQTKQRMKYKIANLSQYKEIMRELGVDEQLLARDDFAGIAASLEGKRLSWVSHDLSTMIHSLDMCRNALSRCTYNVNFILTDVYELNNNLVALYGANDLSGREFSQKVMLKYKNICKKLEAQFSPNKVAKQHAPVEPQIQQLAPIPPKPQAPALVGGCCDVKPRRRAAVRSKTPDPCMLARVNYQECGAHASPAMGYDYGAFVPRHDVLMQQHVAQAAALPNNPRGDYHRPRLIP